MVLYHIHSVDLKCCQCSDVLLNYVNTKLFIYFFLLSIRLCLCVHLNVCAASLPVRGGLPQCTKCVHFFLKETSL